MFRKLLIGITLLTLLLSACGTGPAPTASPAEIPPTAVPPSEEPATFTPTPVPPTETIVPTATPENQIFRDDFTGTLQPGWRWENEKPDRWKVTSDGWLQIIGEDPSLLGGEAQSNLLWRDLPEGDFMITIHLKTVPDSNFQQATIYIYQDLKNYIAINRGYCGPCSTGGNGIYMEYAINGQGNAYMTPFTATDLYLRLESKEKTISGYYATSPDQWQRLGRFGNYFVFKNVGLGVTNADRQGASNSDLVGLFDYFEIASP
jgi:beta-xylosidase